MVRIAFLFHLIVFSLHAYAHEDTIIRVLEGGVLEGLPEQYSPAKIDLNNKVISIGKTKFYMPPCVFKYFNDHDDYRLEVTGSWYHQRSILPPYISFNIFPKEKYFAYSLLFGLDDLRVIEFKVITLPSENVRYLHKIEIDELCAKSINDSYSTK